VPVAGTVWTAVDPAVGACRRRSRRGRGRRRGGVAVDRLLGLLVKPVDLTLQFVGFGQKGLIEFGDDIDAGAAGLVVLAGLAAKAYVDGQGHEISLAHIWRVKGARLVRVMVRA
jgi:hypothetical protein